MALPGGSFGALRVLITGAVDAMVAFGLYLLFAGQLTKHEAVTGAVLAVATACFALILQRCGSRRFHFGVEHLRPLVRAIAAVPLATARTAGALLAAVAGRAPPGLTAASFARGCADDAGTNARRATAVLAASLAPDSFVVRLARDSDVALVHRIVPAVGRPDPGWLV